MTLNPKLFTGLPPARPPTDPRLGLPPPPPRLKFNPAMIQLPPQPTLTDVMIALDTLNKNLAQLSKQIDDGFAQQEQLQQTYYGATYQLVFTAVDNTDSY
jgi:hypothetical protein